ncbi:unnamed protein product [Arabis nemorensis]|uniref:Mechanosensitive ion channel MscS domain-containing protein n=1 Tax=Arabis nemorensis TaxID=586526 RepID=A0A565BF68_9BRAS|nr:unnamed protein product [Arabis nemorensis]
MKRLMNVIRKGTLSTLDEQIQDTTTQEDDKATQIQSEFEAKLAARKIFQNVAETGSRDTYIEDFMPAIYVFVMHPFDFGDRCEIDGVQLVVEEMNILTTVFLRFDNQKIVYPNSLLLTKAIANYYCSPDMQDTIEFFVHIATPPEKITALKQRILRGLDIEYRLYPLNIKIKSIPPTTTPITSGRSPSSWNQNQNA